MKSVKFLAIAVLAWMATGCSKSSEPEVVQSIRIGIGNVQNGDLVTKSVADVLSGTAPSGVPELSLRGVDVSTRSYKVKAGESISVPVGRYTVKAAYKPTVLGTAVFNSVYNEPSYSVNQEVVVSEGVSEYSVDAKYDCFALVIDYAECEKYQWKYWGGNYQDLAWMKRVGDFGVAYFSTENAWGSGETGFTLLALPADSASKESAEYKLSHSAGETLVLVEPGKWYKFGPRDVTFQEGGIGISYPEWVAGQ